MKKNFILCLFILFLINSVDALLTCNGKSLKRVAEEVISGDWGNGQKRVVNIAKYCSKYSYNAIQREVNRILSE